jgi:A/G-specific adenine glycosylase
MLQQTTVAAVRGRYEAFLSRFPSLASLARARRDQVLAAWSGLGYYGRARNLLRAARQVVREHGGRLPRDPDVLRRLPGFGDYTAAAVASLAFGAPAPAADANVTRILSRLFALSGQRSKVHRKAVLRRMAELMPRGRPGDFTAALMDLGQLVCTPRRPACPRCPLSASCAAFRLGRPEAFPRKRARPAARGVHLAVADARRLGRVLLIQRSSGLLSQMWRHPFGEGRTPLEARRRLESELTPLGLALVSRAPSGLTRHTMVNRSFAISVYPAGVASDASPPSRPGAACRWLLPSDFDRAAIPTLTRKIGRAAGFLR